MSEKQLLSEHTNEPIVSVVMPCYNAEKYLEESIRSVLSQTFAQFELIAVNANSQDNTLDILEGLSSTDQRIKVVNSSVRLGPAEARNIAIERASGRYIAFLDSDDIWLPHKLEHQLEFMVTGGHAFTFSFYSTINSSSVDLGHVVKAPPRVTYKQLLYTCPIGCLTVIYDTRILGKRQMPLVFQSEDYALWLQIAKEGHDAVCVPDVLALYRLHPHSLSRNKFVKAKYQWKVYRQVEGFGHLRAAILFFSYFIHGVIKTYVRRPFSKNTIG